MVRIVGPMSKTKPLSLRTFILPPTWTFLSTSVTSWPAYARRTAAATPPKPAPATTTRLIKVSFSAQKSYVIRRPLSGGALVELPHAQQKDQHGHDGQRDDLVPQVREAQSLERDAAQDLEHVRQR